MIPNPHSAAREHSGRVVLLFLLVAFLLVLATTDPCLAANADLGGTWHGHFSQGLRLVLHFQPAPDGGFSGTLDSPDQGAAGIPLGRIVEHGDSLLVEVPALRSEYAALRLSPDSLAGEWRQNGLRLPLGLGRGETEPGKRPQEPRGALPYDTQDVFIPTGDDNLRLAGTLTMPRGGGSHPAVLLVSGSGPQNRDEEVFGHRPFLVIADHLTRAGIAVLRVDDRGVGGSTGRFVGSTSDDFARDAAACAAWLRGRDGVDPVSVGLIGHSEGALIAPLVARRDPRVAFVVLLAGPGTDGEAVLIDQVARQRRAAGIDEETIGRLEVQQRRVFDLLKSSSDSATVSAELRKRLRESLDLLPAMERDRIGDADAYIERMVRMLESPWFRFFIAHDPGPALAALHCPVLALFGEKDLQVSPELNREPMERALQGSASGDVTVRVLPGLNHMFQQADTGEVWEYMQSETTFDPAALDLVSRWILGRFAGDVRASRR